MHHTPRLVLTLLAALSAAPAASTWAAGFPIATSGDGQWVFRTDARNLLHRSAAGGATTDASAALPVPAHALSASADGRTVAYTSRHAPGCIGIATFGDGRSGGTGKTSWLRLDGAVGGPACVAPAAAAAALPMALSGDGKRIALGGAQVRVLELPAMRTALTIPTGGDTVLDLRFVDDGRKLLVAQRAASGELRFAIWDTGRRELFSYQRAAAPAGPASSYAWHFAEATGDLWLVPPAGAATALPLAPPRGRKGKAAPAQPAAAAGPMPLAVNVKQCGRQRGAAVLRPADGGWLASAADPRGRWLATVTRDTDEAGRRYHSRLTVQDSRSGRVLAERLVEGDLQTLAPSANGNMLYGVLGVPVAEGVQRAGLNAGLSQPDGGQLLAFDLAADLGAAAQQPDAPWGARRCPIEDETPQARDIAQDLQPPEAQYTVTLPADAPDISGRACHGDEWWQPGIVSERIRQWGVTPDGRVWLDRVNQLERLDKDTGLAAGRITTPRTDKVCSIPLYDAQQFLVWQGDSVSLRGFTGGASAMLVNKEGWFADSVVRLGDKFGVRWVKAQPPANIVIAPVAPVRPAPPPTGAGAAPAAAAPAAAAAQPSAAAQAAQGAQAALAALAAQAAQAVQGTQPAQPAPAAAAAPVATPDAPIAAPVSAPTVPRGPTATTPIQRGGMGSAIAIVYSADGKPLRQVQGRVANSRPVFAAEQDGGSVFAPEAAAAAAAPKGGYRWLPGYFDSVRATRTGLGTVMWSGLEAQPGDAPPRKPGTVQGLGGAVGAVMEADALSVYDAAQRRRLARIPVEKASDAAWSPVNRMLLVESPAPGNGGRAQLSAYELD
jgi:hypothetical protein